jgi:hypothetical protein
MIRVLTESFILQMSWHHLHCTVIGSETATVCFCPSVNVHQDCVHTLFIKDFGQEQFPNEDTLEERGTILLG